MRKFTEVAIPLHQKLFVSGHSRIRNDAVAAEMAYDKDSPDYLISVKTEEDLISSKKMTAIFTWIFCVGIGGVGGFGLFSDFNRNPFPSCPEVYLPRIGAALGGALGFLFLVPAWAWAVHLSMVKLKNRAKQAVSNLDVELKRRHDLIKSLLKTVKGFSGFEKQTLAEVTALRSQLSFSSADDVGKQKNDSNGRPNTGGHRKISQIEKQ